VAAEQEACGRGDVLSAKPQQVYACWRLLQALWSRTWMPVCSCLFRTA